MIKFLILLLVLLPSTAFAALSAQSIWEVRTAGAATNGGGFVNAVSSKATGTDLAVSSGSNANVSSAGYGFTSADVGRWIGITAGTGFTTGLYKVTSVASGVATLNGSPAAVSTTGGSFTVYWGIDYSQQNAKNTSGSNISTTNLVTAGTTTLSSATAAFTNDIIGNIVYIAGGTGAITAGWYEITAYTNATTVTVDRATGLTTGTGGTLNIGGALNSLNTLSGLITTGNAAYVKADATYSMSTTATFSSSGNNTNVPLYNQLIGYTTTRGDGGYATLQATASGITNLLNFTASSWKVSNIIVDCNSQTTCTGFRTTSTQITFSHVIAKNYTISGIAFANSNGENIVVNSEVTGGISGCTSGILGGNGQGAAPVVAYNYVHDNACTAIAGGQAGYIIGNLVTNNTGSSSDGITAAGPGAFIANNTVYNSGRDGVRLPNFVPNIIYNNIFVSNAGYGINFSGGAGQPASSIIDGNAYYSNTLGARNNLDDRGIANSVNGAAPYTNIHDVTLTSTPFVNASSGNFALNTVAGGGAAARSTGVPAMLPGLSGTSGFPSFGAFQPNQTTIGGGSFSFGQ